MVQVLGEEAEKAKEALQAVKAEWHDIMRIRARATERLNQLTQQIDALEKRIDETERGSKPAGTENGDPPGDAGS